MATAKLSPDLTVKFGFTNNTDTSKTVAIKALNLASDYGKTTNVATKCALNNVTSPTDQPEIIEITGSKIKSIELPQSNLYPPRVTDGISYGIRVAELASVTSQSDARYRVDLPIEVRVDVKHSNNGAITAQMVEEVLVRAFSAFYKTDGSSRIGELMRGALAPDED